jgi:hypothetical protein
MKLLKPLWGLPMVSLRRLKERLKVNRKSVITQIYYIAALFSLIKRTSINFRHILQQTEKAPTKAGRVLKAFGLK